MNLSQKTAEALRRFNLDRPDLAELPSGALVICKIEDLRLYEEVIIELQNEYRMTANLLQQTLTVNSL